MYWIFWSVYLVVQTRSVSDSHEKLDPDPQPWLRVIRRNLKFKANTPSPGRYDGGGLEPPVGKSAQQFQGENKVR